MNEKTNCRKAAVLLMGIALLVLFAGLGFRELASGDETRVAGIAVETFIEGNYLVPRLNGTPFLEYPPLYYWMTAGAYSLFGINDFAAKLPSAFAALGMVMLTFAFARKLKFSIWEALFSGLILLFSSQFISESRTCRVDLLLSLFIELSLFSFYAMTEAKEWKRRLGYWSLFSLSLAGGVYTKGLLGIVLPAAVIGSWLFVSDTLARRFSLSRYAAVFSGGLLALGLAGIWYALLWHCEGKALFDTAFWTNNLGRFTGSQSDHAESVFYYFIKLPSLFLPWLPVLLFAMVAAFRRIRVEKDRRLLFLTLAVLIPFALLCAASGKRVVYLLPLAAPCALLTGWYFGHLPSVITKYLERVSLRKTAMPVLIVVTVAVIGIDIGTAIHMNRKKSLRSLFEYVAKLEQQGRKIYLVDAAERTCGAAYFYLHHALPEKHAQTSLPENNECWIVRRKQAGVKVYADHHVVWEGEITPAKQFQVACFSDFTGNTTVMEKIARRAYRDGADFALIPGDITKGWGTAEFRYVRNRLEDSFSRPFHVVPGNHDLSHQIDAADFVEVFGGNNRFFGYGDTLFIGLDTSRGLTENTAVYLTTTLKREREKYCRCVIFCHIFPSIQYDRSRPPLENETTRFRDAIGKHRIDLLVVGHMHKFQETEFAGIRSVILPSSGQSIRDPENPWFGFAMLNFQPDGAIGIRQMNVCNSPDMRYGRINIIFPRLYPWLIFCGAMVIIVSCVWWGQRRKKCND